MNANKMLVQAFIRVAWTTATHCCLPSVTDYFDACSRCRTLPPISALCSRLRGLYISCLLDWLPRTSYLADDCRLLSDVGRRPLQSNSNDMHCAANT